MRLVLPLLSGAGVYAVTRLIPRRTLRMGMLAAGLVALLLLQYPEASTPRPNPKFPFYEGYPEAFRRFMNGGLYRGLHRFLFDLGFRNVRILSHLSVAESVRQTREAMVLDGRRTLLPGEPPVPGGST